DIIIFLCRMKPAVARRERDIRSDAVIDLRRDIAADERGIHKLIDALRRERRVQSLGIDQGGCVVRLVNGAEKGKCLASKWAVQIEIEQPHLSRRLGFRIGITGIQRGIGDVESRRTMYTIRTGPSNHVNSAEPGFVVFGRKWIRVDLDFADVLFPRKVSLREAVKKNLSAVRPRGRAR